MRRTMLGAQHEEFRSAFRQFLGRHAVPHVQEWEDAGIVDRALWTAAGAAGFLGFEAPVEHGGLGIRDFRFNQVMSEELAALGVPGDGFALHNDIVSPYLVDMTDDAQRRRWLTGFTSGALIPALALTEPDAGSDLSSIRTRVEDHGDEIILTGRKTFITNGSQADLVIVLARTGERGGRGMSLVAVEYGTPGFTRGRPMKKIGHHAQDTADVLFEDCRVPAANIIGTRGEGFASVARNLARERLSIAVLAVAAATQALRLGLEQCATRVAFGQPIGHFQVIRHRLAELWTLVEVTQIYVDRCVQALNDRELTAVEAAGAKRWATDVQSRVVDDCLQFFGGYGYMEESPIARMWRDARVQRIYGGTNEIMNEIIGRSLTP
jgi:acyl-CoA dehydrogenase